MIERTTYEPFLNSGSIGPSFPSVTSIFDQVHKVTKIFLKITIPAISSLSLEAYRNPILFSATVVYLTSKLIHSATGEEVALNLDIPDEFQDFMNCAFDCLARNCTTLSRNPFIAHKNCGPYIDFCYNQCMLEDTQAVEAYVGPTSESLEIIGAPTII
jgi:hypothetical protein